MPLANQKQQMKNTLAQEIVKIKKEFVIKYKGNSHIQEAIPSNSDAIQINSKDLQLLHDFAKNNPIYSNSFEMKICDTDCTVYEGDISNYWIDSIKHDTSYAPFYPTWILSAYALAQQAANMGILEAVDIGSGDGRIAYCCKVAGIRSYGIEIDKGLTELQKTIVNKTGIDFKPRAADATRFDYSIMGLHKPAFFIGGLPEIGEILANSVIKDVTAIKNLAKHAVFVLTGATKKPQTNNAHYGWSSLMNHFKLEEIATITLPTKWTFEQPTETPYIFTRKNTS